VKFMFQPAEENLLGAKDMIEAGILESPKPDAALAVHVAAGKIPVGTYMYNKKSTMMMSSNSFRIDIKGKGGHGAYPGLAISPINIGVDICTKINNLTKEAMADGKSFITIGRFSSGTVSNIIPEEAIIEGSLRSKDNDVRLKQLEQIYEIAENTAKNAGGQATITILSDVPPLVCDTGFTGEIVQMIEDMNKTGMFIGGEQRQGFLKAVSDMEANASDDFACIAEKIPAAYIYLSAGFDDERGDFTAHNSRVIFDENVCVIGAALMAECAMKWLVLGK